MSPIVGYSRVFGAAPDSFQVLAAAKKAEETGATITISSIDFGSGGDIAFAFAWANNGDGKTVSSISINGTAATIHVQAVGVTTAADSLVASATGVTGGTGDITITYSASETFEGVYGVYAIPGLSVEATDSTNATVTSISDSVAITGAGVAISACFSNLNNSTSDYNGGVDTDHRASAIFPTNRPGFVGSREYASGGTANVTTSTVSSSNHRSATASFS